MSGPSDANGSLPVWTDMSMPNWLNNGNAFPSNENEAYNRPSDPSLAFMQTPAGASFEFGQMQNQQLQQRLQNGNIPNGSPQYHQPSYQTQSIVPSKRPRPREDSIGASPLQHPGTLPASRSQTPQGAYPGFPGAVNGNQQLSGTHSYPQFQQASSNPSHSPVMQPQAFNPQAPHQRLQTASPAPFSPVSQNFGIQGSPPQSEHGSRVNTPQNNGQHFVQGIHYGGVGGQPFTPPPGSAINGAALSQYSHNIQNQQQQQRILEARMRQFQQQRQQAGILNSVQSSNHLSAHQVAALQAQQVQQAQQRNSPEQILRSITHWAQQNGQPFNPSPFIAGRQISCAHLFITVQKLAGSKAITARGQWATVAGTLGFQEPQIIPVAAHEIQQYWHTSIAGFEPVWQMQQQQRRAMMDAVRTPNHVQANNAATRQDHISPTKQIHSQQSQQLMQPPAHMRAQYQTPTKHMASQIHEARSLPNGYMNHQQAQSQGKSSSISTNRPSVQGPTSVTANKEFKRIPAAAVSRAKSEQKDDPRPSIWTGRFANPFDQKFDIKTDMKAQTHEGLEVEPQSSKFSETIDYLVRYKPSVPKLEELGIIDIRALTLSLRSGIHGEVRLALDTLASLSILNAEENGLCLDHCEDLLETLIDFADDQVQLLAEHSAEVSDAMLLNSYEETIRGCKVENVTLQRIPEFGSLDYDLDRAADRLICITTILRNLSLTDANHLALADSFVVRCLASIIRYIGTRSMLLRTHQNLLDFSKDVVILLSTISNRIDMPGREEALCILHFLLSFAPTPAPNNPDQTELAFSPWVPKIHRYYHHAVDGLAKLLARGDPNRAIYRTIFIADGVSSPPYDLLTRAFGLSIAVIPDGGSLNLLRSVAYRAPSLIHGLLAAEILASLIPSTEQSLAQAWLASQDGFALSLMKIAIELGKQQVTQSQRHRDGRTDPDPHGYVSITDRAYAVLRRLAEKAKDADGYTKKLPFGLIPHNRIVVGAVIQPNSPSKPSNVVKQLCALSDLDR